MARETRPWEGITHDEFLIQIAPDVIQYVNWYAEDGKYLPTEFHDDPAAWTEVLREIGYGFTTLLNGATDAAEVRLMYNRMQTYYKYSQYLFRP